MKRRFFLSFFLIASALVIMGQIPACTAPMDATGDYSGKWSFNITEDETILRTVDCALTATLEQDVTLDYPKNLKVTASVYVDFYCLADEFEWPPWLPIPEPQMVDVTGNMHLDGRIVLYSAGCGPGVCIILTIDGYGESDDPINDEIPLMRKYSGTWNLAVGIAFLGFVEVEGVFEVTRDV